MQGKEIIKAILDQGLVDEELKVLGVKDDSVTVDDTISYSINEITTIEMEDGVEQAAICISGTIVE